MHTVISDISAFCFVQYLQMFDFKLVSLHIFRSVIKESQSVAEIEMNKDSSKTSVSGKSSRTGREGKAYVSMTTYDYLYQ